jgi:hypothetical protein
MKESENLKPTETKDSSLEVKPEEEKKILASLKSESFSLVPDQLNAIMAKCHLQSEVDPASEKEITAHLKEEAATFVPDKLQDIMKACGIDNSVSSEDEETLVHALEGDGAMFIPNDLGAVKKATGTYNPYLDQAALATQEKLHNEAADVVPNVEDKIYKETGAKKHFSFRNYFKKHWIPLTSGFAVAAAAIAVIVIVPNAVKQTSASGTYVAVTITPASSLLTTAGANYLYANATTGTTTTASYTINKYTPSWSYAANSDNLVDTTTFTPRNYSAKLLEANLSLSSTLSASKAAATLVTPSYKGGYLQNVQENNAPVYNDITIDVYSTDSSYASKYQDDYKSALSDALATNKVYANVTFNVTNIADDLLGVSTAKAQKLLDICTAVNSVSDADSKITFAQVKKLDDTVIGQMTTLLSSASTAQMTPRALSAIKEGLGMMINGTNSDLSETDFEKEKNTLISTYAQDLPWNNGVTNLNQIKAGLQNEGYYMVGGTIKGTDGDSVAWSMFKDLRNYIIKKETAENDSFVALLENETSLILNRGMPDGLNGERPDDGNHHAGEPGSDWHGGIGDFGPGTEPHH